MRGDNIGVTLAIGGAFLGAPGSGSVTLGEAKQLVGGWSKGTFETTGNSLRYHFAEHGTELGAKNVWQYMRKAEAFLNNLRGAKTMALEGGGTRYTKSGRYIILDKDKKILSFGAAR